jgi:hypothetical protein
VSIQWTGRLSPGGTMGFSSFATATGPNGPIQTQLTDCGVTGNDSGSWDAASFDGQCSITPSENGQISVSIRNGTVEALTDIAAFFVSKTSTGTAGAFNLSGPAPRVVSNLTAGGRREFVFGARFLGDGQITMRFKGRGIRSTHQSVETAEIECTAQVGGQNTNLPDLSVFSDELQDSVLIETQNFGPDSCALVEGCINAAGSRKLLRFNTVTPNYGPGDVFLGDPLGNPEFVFSACHNHYHFTEYADYRLLDMGGQIVARGHKQAFCLIDLWQPPGLGGDPRPQFPTCEFQGISAGWADVYDRSLDCQWIDITGVPAGHYILEVQINPAHIIKEHNYDNNVGRAEVDVH